MFCEKSTRCNFTLITKSEETCPICFPVFTLFVLLFLDTTVEEKIQEIEGVIDLLIVHKYIYECIRSDHEKGFRERKSFSPKTKRDNT